MYNTAPTYDGAHNPQHQLSQLQSQRDEEIRDRLQHNIALQYKRQKAENERKTCIKLSEITQRQMIIQKEQQLGVLPQPVTVKGGIGVQLRTTQTPSETLTDIHTVINSYQTEKELIQNVTDQLDSLLAEPQPLQATRNPKPSFMLHSDDDDDNMND